MEERKVGRGVVRLVRGDITQLEVDAFVNDITADCKLGSGWGGAIAARAGRVVQDELDAIGTCPTGQAVATTAGRLKARWIVHANGPKFHEPDCAGKLRAALESALQRAEEKGARSLAVPPLGTGLYQVPLDLCARVITETASRHLQGPGSVEEVLLVAADAREHAPLAASLQNGASR